MHNRLILLSLLALVLLGTALCQVTKIPASQDVYVGLGTGNEQVFNQTETLRCGVNVTDLNGIKASSYPGAPMIQFDIAGLNITDDDIAILVLKAASIEKGGNDSAMATLLPISSEWNEDSDYTVLLVNILPIWDIVKKNDISQTSSDADEDRIFAFDISKKLKDAKAKGDRISFLMMAISNSSYEIDFLSRESGQGPYLMVTPYPGESKGNLTLVLNQTTSLPSNEAETNETKQKVPATAGLQNSSGINRSLVFSSQENMDETTGRPALEKIALKM
ncbi:MAG: hypothetical protein NTV25_00500 [Methanothrix sp.]|nr:hypothetical protein [Methanothrix sp.]